MTTLQEALPCPFCGKQHTLQVISGQELMDENQEFWQHSESFGVVCDASTPDGKGGCGAMGGFKPTEEEAIEAWNRRTALAQHREQQPVCHGCGIPAGDVHMSTCKSGKWPSRVSNGDTAAPAPQAQQGEPTDDQLVKGVKAMRLFVTKNSVADFKLGYMAALAAAPQAQEPACPECGASLLYECVACSYTNYPKKQDMKPQAQDKNNNYLNGYCTGRTDLLKEQAAPQPAQEPTAWRTGALKWIRRKAEDQRATNEQNPRHAEAYPSWGERVRQWHGLADELELEQNSTSFGLEPYQEPAPQPAQEPRHTIPR